MLKSLFISSALVLSLTDFAPVYASLAFDWPRTTRATGAYSEDTSGRVQTMLGFREEMTVNVSFRIQEEVRDEVAFEPNETGSSGEPVLGTPVVGDPKTDEFDDLEWDSGVPVGPIFDIDPRSSQ